MLLTILRVLAMTDSLSRGVMEQPGDPTPPTVALVHSYHARAAATDAVPATLLLAIGYKESRYIPVAKPQCGVTQIATYGNRRFCRALVADPGLAYATTVEHLDYWREVCRRRGEDLMACALTGYGKGTAAAKGPPSGYARNTLWRARVIAGEVKVRRAKKRTPRARAATIAPRPNA